MRYLLPAGWRRRPTFGACDHPQGLLRSRTQPIRSMPGGDTATPGCVRKAQARVPVPPTGNGAQAGADSCRWESAISRRDFSEVELSPHGPCGELTPPPNNRISNLTTASPRGKSTGPALQGCCACSPVAVVDGHGAGEYTRDGAQSEEKVPSGDRRHQTSGVCASRRVDGLGRDARAAFAVVLRCKLKPGVLHHCYCGEKGGQVPFLRVGGEGESFPGRHGFRIVFSSPNFPTAFATHFSEPYGRLFFIA